jgi:hypothetical protein
MTPDPADPNIFFVFVPFESHSVPVSHKRVAIRLIEDFPQYRDIPYWSNVLVQYLAKVYKPSEICDTEVCEVQALSLAHFYLKKHEGLLTNC